MIKDFTHAHLLPPGYSAHVDYPAAGGDYILRVGRLLIDGEQLCIDVPLKAEDATLSDLDMQKRILDPALKALRDAIAQKITWCGKPLTPDDHVDMIAYLLDREKQLSECNNMLGERVMRQNKDLSWAYACQWTLTWVGAATGLVFGFIAAQWWLQ